VWFIFRLLPNLNGTISLRRWEGLVSSPALSVLLIGSEWAGGGRLTGSRVGLVNRPDIGESSQWLSGPGEVRGMGVALF
jgi:hypothetical protein